VLERSFRVVMEKMPERAHKVACRPNVTPVKSCADLAQEHFADLPGAVLALEQVSSQSSSKNIRQMLVVTDDSDLIGPEVA